MNLMSTTNMLMTKEDKTMTYNAMTVPINNEDCSREEALLRMEQGWFSRADLAKLLGNAVKQLMIYVNSMVTADNVTKHGQSEPLKSIRLATTLDYTEFTGYEINRRSFIDLRSLLFADDYRYSWTDYAYSQMPLIAYENALTDDDLGHDTSMYVEAWLMVNEKKMICREFEIAVRGNQVWVRKNRFTTGHHRSDINKFRHGKQVDIINEQHLAKVIDDIISIRSFSTDISDILSDY